MKGSSSRYTLQTETNLGTTWYANQSLKASHFEHRTIYTVQVVLCRFISICLHMTLIKHFLLSHRSVISWRFNMQKLTKLLRLFLRKGNICVMCGSSVQLSQRYLRVSRTALWREGRNLSETRPEDTCHRTISLAKGCKACRCTRCTGDILRGLSYPNLAPCGPVPLECVPALIEFQAD